MDELYKCLYECIYVPTICTMYVYGSTSIRFSFLEAEKGYVIKIETYSVISGDRARIVRCFSLYPVTDRATIIVLANVYISNLMRLLYAQTLVYCVNHFGHGLEYIVEPAAPNPPTGFL